MTPIRTLATLLALLLGCATALAGDNPGDRIDIEAIRNLRVTINPCPAIQKVASASGKVKFPKDRKCPCKLQITVEANVERHNADLDWVNINDQRVISSSGEYACGMLTVTQTVVVEVSPDDPKITLTYDTVDGYFNKGAYAKITDVVVMESDCESGSCGGASGGHVSNKCVNVNIPLRESADAAAATMILLNADEPSSNLYSPAALVFHPLSSATEVIRAPSGALRQIRTAQTFVSVMTPTDSSQAYDVCFYPATVTDTKDSNGLYTLTSTASSYETWRFANPPGSTDNNSLSVTKLQGGATISSWTYHWVAAANGWTLTSGSGADIKKELRYTSTSGQEKTYGHQILDGSDNSLLHEQTVTQTFAWGEEVVRKVVDPADAALTTLYYYYSNQAADGDNYGQLKGTVEADGSWTRYEYDGDGRVIKTITPFGNAPWGSADALCRVVTVAYQDNAPQETTTETVLGAPVAKSWLVRELVDTDYHPYLVSSSSSSLYVKRERQIRAAAPANAWNNAANPVTVTDTIQTATNVSGLPAALQGQVCRILNPDGTATFRTFAYDANTTVTETRGALATDGKSIADGTRTVTVTNWAGQQVSTAEYDIASGLQLSGRTQSGFDTSGRATRIDYFDGTYETLSYACCGLAARTGRDGIVTSYTYDALGRVDTQAAAGLTTRYTYDALGRTLQTERLGSGNSAILQNTSTYDSAGRLAASADALGLVTTTAYSADGRMVTTTYPGGGTRIETRYRDGQTCSVSGTAVIPEYYEFGVNSDGTQWSKSYSGAADNTAPRWRKNTTDFLGRGSQEETPASASTVLVEFSFYNAYGQRVRTEQRDQNEILLSAPTLYEYNGRGEIIRTGQDVDGGGALVLASTDRIQDQENGFVQDGGVWWRSVTAKTYPTTGATAVTLSVNKEQVSGLGAAAPAPYSGKLTSCSKSLDIRGNATTTSNYTDAATQTVWQVTTVPGATQPAVTVTVNGLQTSQTSVTGVTTTFGYDALGRRTTVTDPRTGVSTVHYNTLGQIDYAQDAAGNQTAFSYDPATGRQVAVTNALGKKQYKQYDLQGRVLRIWGDTDYPVEYAYDLYGQTVTLKTFRSASVNFASATWPENPGAPDVTTWSYEPATGLLLAKTYADGHGPAYIYDTLGRLKTRTWARLTADNQPIVTTYSYSPATGELLTVDYSDTTPDVTYTYDRLGHRSTIVDACGTRTFYYNSTLEEQFEFIPANGRRCLQHNHDSLGRVVSVTQLYWPQNPSLEHGVIYTYDPQSGRPATVTQRIWQPGTNSNPTDTTVTYGYLPNSDLLATTTYSSTGVSRTVSYEPHRDLVTSVEHKMGQTTLSAYTYSNDAIGRRTAMARSGTAFAAADTINYDYNDRSEVTSAGSTLLAGNNYKYDYQYDPIGNRLSENHNGNISNYTTNSLNQYTERTVPGVFDFLGSANPAAKVTVTSPADSASPADIHTSTRQGPYWHAAIPVDNSAAAIRQSAKATGVLKGQGTGGKDIVTEQNLGSFFVPRTPEAFTYDADGNLTADGRWVYTWDAENRLIQAETATVKIENSYDYQSRRVEKKKYTRADAAQAWQLVKRERFLYNGFRLFESFTYDVAANATTLQAFTWDDLRDELLAVHDVDANATYLVAHDANRNVTELVSPAGEIKAHYEYGPFGQPLVQTGAYAAQNPFRFSSEQFDADLALVYYNYRYYNANTGRWLGRDPIGEQGACNLYVFIANNPLSKWDNFGLVFDDWNITEGGDMGLALRLIIHYCLGRGKEFTSGGNVVSNQKMVKEPIKTVLMGNAAKLLGNNTEETGSIQWTMADTGDIYAQNSIYMLNTLNGATGFDIKGTFIKKNCKVTYSLTYTFIDVADMHFFRNGKLLFPDYLLIIHRYTNPLWWGGIMEQDYPIRISWDAETKITKALHGYKYEGWPF